MGIKTFSSAEYSAKKHRMKPNQNRTTKIHEVAVLSLSDLNI